MRIKKRKYSMLLLLLVLGVTVGYAFLSTTLNINGTTKIKDAKWDVYWDNPVVTTGSVTTTAPTIDSIKTTATFDITLNNPKDYYEFTIDAVNAGTIDAMIKVNGVSNKVYSDSGRTEETTLPDAIKYTVTYADGTTIQDKHLLAKKSGDTPTRETYKVRIEYRNDEETTAQDLEEITSDTTYYMSFSVEYVQAENAIEAHPVSAITYINRQVEGQITPGDIIGIGETEDFYVISSNAEKTVLLAKYNLLVGNIVEDFDIIGQVQPTDPGYGLQSVDAVGGYGRYESYIGDVAFSSINYWMDNNNLTSEYNKNDTIYYDSNSWAFKNRSDDSRTYPYVYNNSLTAEPDFNNDGFDTPGYSIAYYVELYKTKLIKMGAPSTITGRLLSYEEAEDKGVIVIHEETGDYYESNPIIYNNQSYWLGSAGSEQHLSAISYTYDESICIEYCGNVGYSQSKDSNGVRPVIEIPTSALK